MRRCTALAVAVLITSASVAAGPAAVAQGGPPDPVDALKRQFREEHGVRTSETARVFFGAKSRSAFRISGRVQFGPSGVVAVDLTWRDVPEPGNGPGGKPSEKAPSYRVIRVGKDVYYDVAQYPGPVPDGKKWIRRNHAAGMTRYLAPAAGLQPVNVYDPSVLKAVLKRSRSTPVSGGRLYQGTMSHKEMGRVTKGRYVDPFSGLSARKSKGKISWRLWTGRDGLVARLVTTDTLGAAKTSVFARTDTRYTGWGCRLVITAPPADEVVEQDDLAGYVPEPDPAH
ncbi:hypothetical protein [Microbispora siamensis]|uniref:Lipoprotein n=1 Tax=Microbispora siamensis TaxID=564413 RepID=A0ABQ4GMY6_9ACTN|nr:hypothetical protein [Microbispora siamensis]GIH62792.1 hypothetical protein Msi02_36090 [Microbispora siamensis]